MKRLTRVWLAVGLGLAALGAARADYCPPDSPASGGMRDIMLAYMSKDAWTRENYRPYVAYLDKRQGGRPTDWFYDAFLLLMFSGAPSGGAYYNGTATLADWKYYLDLLYAPDKNLAALNDEIAAAGEQLKDPGRVCPVIIMIPYLSANLKDFGDVDGDGQPENPARDEDRARACNWLVDEFLRRWDPAKYPHLKLWGFYWMMEDAGPRDERLTRAVADHVHSKGLGLHWIPYYRAAGYDRWRELGFDFTVMQPNYAFTANPRGAVVPDEGRLTRNANLCRAHGLGYEMEMDSGIADSPAKRLNLRSYLNHGVPELDGYMTDAVRAYYQAEDLIASLYRSDLAECNQLYDDLYRFHKGTYTRRPVSLAEGAAARLNGQPATALTDGVWLTQPGHGARVQQAAAPLRADLDLGAGQIVGDVRVHVVAGAAGQPARPTALRVLTSADGREYSLAGEAACPDLETIGDWEAGFALVTFAPRSTRAVRVEIEGPPGSSLALDEIVILPSPHLLWGAAGTVAGTPVGGGPAEAVLKLTDGKLVTAAGQPGGVQFREDTAGVTLRVGERWLLDEAVAHVRPAPGQTARCRVVTLASGQATHTSAWSSVPTGGAGWITVALPSAPAEEVRFELTGAQATWDELQVRPAPNLAQGKPYRVLPAFTSQYPDTEDKELTDGLLTAQGFGDGRTVGWFGNPEVTVRLDLGQTRELTVARAFVEGGGYAAVWDPPTTQVWGSADGTAWRLLAGQTPGREQVAAEQVGEEAMQLSWLSQGFPAASVRYLEYRFTTRGWLMLSELEALTGGTNVAAGCRYYLWPTPKSEQRYADDGRRLTDGDTSRPSDGWHKAVGWSDGTPEIIVDLLRPQPVGIVRAHILGGGNGGVWYPAAVGFSTSPDGTTWTAEVSVSAQLPEPGNASQATFVEAALPPGEARFVRLRLQRRGWAMIDEVQVFGPPR